MQDSEREREERKQQLSSLVWICTSTHQVSRVTIIDANNPADILEAFSVCQNHLLCIASVPGAVLSDYLNEDDIDTNIENPAPVSVEETTAAPSHKEEEKKDKKEEETENSDDPIIGRITFVSCATGSEDTAGLPPAPPPSTGPTNTIENEFSK
ncbi:hypothetical protein LSTR_LSTR015037 [Laodelphax striatellus]|uniref:Uncharacterized protein n=1 Tax=Laodelphax striatellus TaxID=195883 RepID=A0A482XHS0_LAOST|nr:hypothetical protein LSTR_LSTR015037 [Laodelphax striatellus]